MSFKTSTLDTKTSEFAVYLNTHRLEWEARQYALKEMFARASELGLLGLETPTEHGGLGAPFSDKVELARRLSHQTMAATFAMINSQNVATRLRLSNHSHHHQMADEIMAAKRIGCTALTEPHAGSDFAAITTSAEKVDGGWRLNGQKAWITNAAISDVIICYAQTEPGSGGRGIASFVVDAKRSGFERLAPYELTGGHMIGTGRFRLDNYRAANEDLLTEPDNERWARLSIEFCGGTHLKKTGDAEGFVILSQDAVSKGVRRITAVTGAAAHKASAQGEALLHRVESLKDAPMQELETHIDEVNQAVNASPIPLVLKQKIQSGVADLSQRVKEYAKAEGSKQEEVVVESAREIADGTPEDAAVIVAEVPGADAKTLRTAMDVIRKKRPGAAMLLAAAPSTDKVALLASVPKEMIAKGLKAGDWVKHTAPIVGGGGGGRPDMAQAGGKDASKIAEALTSAQTYAEERLG